MEDIHASFHQCNYPSSQLPNIPIMNSNVMLQEEGLNFVQPSLAPITPYSIKHSLELISNFTSPPQQHSHSDYLCNSTEPSTPKQGIFDPFAPGPDNLMLAPHSTKHLKHSFTYVSRRLNFPSLSNVDGDANCVSDDEPTVVVSDDDDEDTLLEEAVYQTLLKAIISKQAEEEILHPPAISSSSPPPSPDGFKTPTSAPLLNGIADTCPAAPLKPQRKLRNINLGLCRKLEF